MRDCDHKHSASFSIQTTYELPLTNSGVRLRWASGFSLMMEHWRLTRMASLMNPKWNGQFSCFDLVAKTAERPRSVVRVGDIEIGGNDFVVMAGPCAVESESQLLQTAEAVARAGAANLPSGGYKPRSSPYAF